MRCALALLVLALTAAPAPAAVRVERGVVYGSAEIGSGSTPLLLDLYRPAKRTAARRPVVVLIHGGGFSKRTRADPGIVRIARRLARRGIVAASIDYRLVGQDPRPSGRVAPLLAGLPDGALGRVIASAVDDTLTAIDYLRATAAEHGIDAARLGLIGSSAGAITANHVAYVLDDYGIAKPRIRFVGDLWGGILVAPPGGGDPAALQLDRGEAPLFAVHGDADPTVPVRLDDELVARARGQHVRSEYHRLPGAGHGYELSRFFTREVVREQTPFDRLVRFARRALAP